MAMNTFGLAAEEFTVLAFAGILSLVYFAIGIWVYKLDKSENSKCLIEFLQDDVNQNDVLYAISMTVTERLCSKGTSDIILRLRGSVKDSPLILFRDLEQRTLNDCTNLNLGIALPFSLGELVEVDIATDNDRCEENEPVISISDIYVYKLSGQSHLIDSKEQLSTWKRSISAALFTVFSSNLLAWVCVGSITNASGIGILGLPKKKKGKPCVLRAREVCLSLPLTKENDWMKKRAAISYPALHYFFSLFGKWHDVWSNFSAIDQITVMFFDQLTAIIFISLTYAFALEKRFGFTTIQIISQHSGAYEPIEDFDLHRLFSRASRDWASRHIATVIYIVWIAFIGTLMAAPLSLLWCRLFRLVGGKGFNWNNVEKIKKMKKSMQLSSKKHIDEKGLVTDGLMLRTLECKSIHTGSSVTSSRRLRIEPMLCNCPPDKISTRTIAYIRTKMARLREEDAGKVDASEPKASKVLHESHTQSTDAPQMPFPVAGPNGSGDVVGVARYCERLVQQAPEHIRDRSVIAECFEVARDSSGNGSDVSGVGRSRQPCCPRQCSKRNKKCHQESLSNTSFFSEEDAASVKEMLSNFSLNQDMGDFDRELRMAVGRRAKAMKNRPSMREKRDKNSSQTSGETAAKSNTSVLAPSAGVMPPKQVSSSRKVILKNSGTETLARAAKKSSVQRAAVSGSRKLGLDSPAILIGRERDATSRDKWKKVRYRLQEAVTPRRFQSRKLNGPKGKSAPHPSGYAIGSRGSFTTTDSPSKTSLPDDVTLRHLDISYKRSKYKFAVFLALLVGLVLAIYLVTAFKFEDNYFFKETGSTNGWPKAGRMHAAILSCAISCLLYCLITVHLIALSSFAIELFVYWIVSRRRVDCAMTNDCTQEYSVV